MCAVLQLGSVLGGVVRTIFKFPEGPCVERDTTAPERHSLIWTFEGGDPTKPMCWYSVDWREWHIAWGSESCVVVVLQRSRLDVKPQEVT